MLNHHLRKAILTVHIILSVGWLGSVLAFLVLAITGLTSNNTQLISACYLTMEIIARFAIVPLSFMPLLTGPILSLGTPWGLFRHYWILVKLLITVISTIVLQIHLTPIENLAASASHLTLPNAGFFRMQLQMVVASGAAVIALVTSTLLSVYKPQGLTPFGQRKRLEKLTQSSVG